MHVCVFVCVCAREPVYGGPAPRLLITSGVMCHDMDLIQLYMPAVVGIVSRRSLSFDAHHRYQPNKSKLVLYKPLLSLKQLFKTAVHK